MNTLKKISNKLCIIAIGIFISTAVIAQPPGGGPNGDKKGPPPIPDNEQIVSMVNDLSSNILLSETQKELVLNLYIRHFDEVRTLTANNARPGKEIMEANKKAFHQEVRSYLTNEQIPKYNAYLKSNKGQRKS